MAAESGRQAFDTPWQPSACGDMPGSLKALYHDLTESLEQVKNEIRLMDGNISVRFDSVETQLQFLESCHRNSKFLSKMMSMHKNSENMNDPFRLSAVLKMYETLRLHEWKKFRRVSSLTYKSGSKIIKKLFDACEKDIQQRTTNIFGVLDIPPSNDAMTNSKQEVMQERRNLFRYSYNQNDSKIYHNIITDPPVKAVWNLYEMHCLEHVDKKGSEHWENPAFLWPIMKCGEQLMVKGVVWDEK
ncbi:hypothetical protein llap_608 [Limosa lapponica baueri]|uniref:Uncharacterized protein n=1 Tax=Limosa lapponica baueri TaxID=1758121 RepID=A0A2I0USC4_LIMLA|nr:hypothetical protein llap_608 [Limosa lapponica baueri]